MGQSVVEQKLMEYADVYNAWCFDGKPVLDEGSLELLPAIAYTRDVDGEVRGRLRDVRMMCGMSGGEYRMVCQIENQTDVDHTMPLRVMGYEYASYEKQVDDYQDANKEAGRDAGSRRLFAEQKLVPVMSIVVNFGERRWKRPLSIHDMLKWPKNVPESVKELVSNVKIKVIDVSYLSKEQRKLLKSDFRIVVEYLACKGDIGEWEEFLKEDHPIRHVEALLDVLWELSNDEMYHVLLESIRKKEVKKEAWSMCYVIDEYMRRGEERGMKLGEERGMKRGMKRGVKHGMLQGMEIMKEIKEKIRCGNDRDMILNDITSQFKISNELAGEYYEVLARN